MAKLGFGTPFFAGSRPPLRFVAGDRIGEDTMSERAGAPWVRAVCEEA
jgi:hypothetical protein